MQVIKNSIPAKLIFEKILEYKWLLIPAAIGATLFIISKIKSKKNLSESNKNDEGQINMSKTETEKSFKNPKKTKQKLKNPFKNLKKQNRN